MALKAIILKPATITRLTVTCHLRSRSIGYVQGDHLTGKTGNVREFDSCQGNVRDFTKSQGNVGKKSCEGKVA